MGFHTIIYAILLYVQQNKNLTRYSYDSNAVTMGNIGRHIIQIILVSSCRLYYGRYLLWDPTKKGQWTLQVSHHDFNDFSWFISHLESFQIISKNLYSPRKQKYMKIFEKLKKILKNKNKKKVSVSEKKIGSDTDTDLGFGCTLILG